MARVDLHCHSRFSDHPSEWFLQRIGAAESYTEPERVYADAKARGMKFVTLTDHNSITGAIQLKRAHPGDFIMGVETTTYFPQDRCKVHVLLWGFDEDQFDHIQDLRHDIYRLRDYIREQRIAHSVAHASFAVNDRLRVEHLEQLMVLFDNFEVLNGARTKRQNELLRHILDSLTPARMAVLCREYRLEPFGESSWDKGLTGGSDDHAGLFIGRCWTEASAESPEAFLEALRSHKTRAAGRHNDYRSLAFSIYKIACDHSRDGRAPATRALLSALGDALFAEENGSSRRPLRSWLSLIRFRRHRLGSAVADLADTLKDTPDRTLDERLDIAYDRIADIADQFVLSTIDSAKANMASGDVANFMRDVSAALPAAFMAAPFMSTMHVLNKGRAVAEEVAKRQGVSKSVRPKRLLWFTDTLSDLNGVSVTLRSMADAAARRGDCIKLVVCGDEERGPEGRLLALPSIYTTRLPYYDSQQIRVPSVLNALRAIQEFEPDEILLSTPGPVGLVGLLAARLLDVPSRSIYHTDFAAQLEQIGGVDSPVELVEAYVSWFYGKTDRVLAPTREYAQILAQRGMPADRIGLFRRGVDTRRFVPQFSEQTRLKWTLGLDEGPVLGYVGRVSGDKRLGVLLDVFEQVSEFRPDVQLLVVGDGPYLSEMRKRAAGERRVVFAGALANADLPAVYPACDLLVFPSTTDTFGMAVLEAQACGVPAVVSNVGGPREVIEPNRSGVIVSSEAPSHWTNAILALLDKLDGDPEAYASMRAAARTNAMSRSWDDVLDELTERPLDPRASALGIPGILAPNAL